MKTPAAPAHRNNRGGTLPIDLERSRILDPQDQSTSDRFSETSVPLDVHPLGCSRLLNLLNQHHFQAHCTTVFCAVPRNRIFSSGLNLPTSFSSLCLCGLPLQRRSSYPYILVCVSPQMSTFPTLVP